MALVSGRSPVRLLDEGAPDTWQELDLEVVSQWKHMKDVKCTGCGRPLADHLASPTLGREEAPTDYEVYSIDCPAQQAIAAGQDMWRTAYKNQIEAHQKGTGPDPSMGVYWLTKRAGERLPIPETD